MMDSRITAATSAGSITQVDGAAMEAALDAIDSALSSSASSGGSRLDPAGMKDRVDSLIADQVSAGTLTEDQAAQLQSLFAQGGPQQAEASDSSSMSIDGMSGVGGAGGPRGMHGPPPPPPSDEEDNETTVASTDATSTAEQLDSIIAFLQNLRNSMASSLYGGSASASDSSNSGLVVDSLA
jgi:hypothetical protein